ncbi:hypothetical protein EGR_03096 [Echinococcus granulosus]|uniref:Uncharacterized protein n=1 Tax=Echinococcus granulosus TaxID=6210 RepID=W6UKL8_ECHGR|nr:hypothetical protein EGR_03096 [Echinococcus granulosus]EUB62075.1 hypothetical protein EGR_03096 [Echinococcus granulosus]
MDGGMVPYLKLPVKVPEVYHEAISFYPHFKNVFETPNLINLFTNGKFSQHSLTFVKLLVTMWSSASSSLEKKADLVQVIYSLENSSTINFAFVSNSIGVHIPEFDKAGYCICELKIRLQSATFSAKQTPLSGKSINIYAKNLKASYKNVSFTGWLAIVFCRFNHGIVIKKVFLFVNSSYFVSQELFIKCEFQNPASNLRNKLNRTNYYKKSPGGPETNCNEWYVQILVSKNFHCVAKTVKHKCYLFSRFPPFHWLNTNNRFANCRYTCPPDEALADVLCFICLGTSP